MRKWFEWMQQHLDARSDNSDFVTQNIYVQTQCLRDWLDTAELEITTGKVFTGKTYIENIKDETTLGIDRQTIAEWIDDPEYNKLIKLVGTNGRVTLTDDIKKQFIEQVKDIFPIDWSNAELLVAAQRPGELFPLHYDRYKDTEDAWRGQVKRWIIMIHDRRPGQCFFMNDKDIPWKAGDIVNWDHTRYHHGSANFGYYTRYSVRITGRLLDPGNDKLAL
jgi:hypothetical protein